MQRNLFCSGGLAALALVPRSASAVATRNDETVAALERKHGGRLGVAALDTGSGRRLSHRADERFPMCSTFKMLTVAAVLHQVDRGNEKLDRRVTFVQNDILDYAPVTRLRIGKAAVGAISVAELCAAAIEWSDNTAANLLLHSLAGPSAVTRYARSLGDPITRLDRDEPTLNTAIPGDPRDTTTPAAMVRNIEALIFGTALSPHSRSYLKTLMLGCRTGAHRLRAGLPQKWRIGDKTGSGDHATANDIGFIEVPRRAPIVIASYYTASSANAAAQDATLAAVGRIVAKLI